MLRENFGHSQDMNRIVSCCDEYAVPHTRCYHCSTFHVTSVLGDFCCIAFWSPQNHKTVQELFECSYKVPLYPVSSRPRGGSETLLFGVTSRICYRRLVTESSIIYRQDWQPARTNWFSGRHKLVEMLNTLFSVSNFRFLLYLKV